MADIRIATRKSKVKTDPAKDDQKSIIYNYRLPITNYQLPITNYQLPITDYQLPITNYQLPITNHPLPILTNISKCLNRNNIIPIT